MIRRMFIRTKYDPKLDRTRVQIVESVRTGKKVRQKILRHVGTAHNESELETIKRLAGQLMDQLRADRTPQMELFTPTEYSVLQNLVHKAPRSELDFVQKSLKSAPKKFRLRRLLPERAQGVK